MPAGLAVVRSLGTARSLQYALAMAGAGVVDRTVAKDRAALFDFVRFLGRPVWSAEAADADRYLVHLRRDRGLAAGTVRIRAWNLASFFEFLIARYQGNIHALCGVVVVQ